MNFFILFDIIGLAPNYWILLFTQLSVSTITSLYFSVRTAKQTLMSSGYSVAFLFQSRNLTFQKFNNPLLSVSQRQTSEQMMTMHPLRMKFERVHW